LDAGANPDIINIEGRTAADVAADRLGLMGRPNFIQFYVFVIIV
jgi:hypothetical protein